MCLLSRFSRVWLCVTPWTVACQAPLSMEFFRQECWRGLPCPPPGDFPDSGIEPMSPALQADSLPLNQWGSPMISYLYVIPFTFQSAFTSSTLFSQRNLCSTCKSQLLPGLFLPERSKCGGANVLDSFFSTLGREKGGFPFWTEKALFFFFFLLRHCFYFFLFVVNFVIH